MLFFLHFRAAQRSSREILPLSFNLENCWSVLPLVTFSMLVFFLLFLSLKHECALVFFSGARSVKIQLKRTEFNLLQPSAREKLSDFFVSRAFLHCIVISSEFPFLFFFCPVCLFPICLLTPPNVARVSFFPQIQTRKKIITWKLLGACCRRAPTSNCPESYGAKLRVGLRFEDAAEFEIEHDWIMSDSIRSCDCFGIRNFSGIFFRRIVMTPLRERRCAKCCKRFF